MGRIAGHRLMFDEDSIREVRWVGLPLLIRKCLYMLRITNEGFLSRYAHHHRVQNRPDKTQKENSQKAASDRKFLQDPRKLSINMMTSVLHALGYEVEAISIRITERLSGDTFTVSTDDSIDHLRKLYEQSQQSGIDGIEA